jgi:RNA polymerase sigma factor (TIGR02999 family)
VADPRDVTVLLIAWRQGETAAFDELASRIYGELRRMAATYLRREIAASLQPPILVNEAFLRLLPQRSVDWQSRSHFFGIASKMMRRVLVDRARARLTAKRGAAPLQVSLTAAERLSAPEEPVDMIGLDEALTQLEAMDPRSARVVELRFFGGLTHEEIACLVGISCATVEREWSTARAWLRHKLEK